MRTREALVCAREAGRGAGEAAASWMCDGNTSREWFLQTLRGLQEGDPKILDSFTLPDLSGEWADGETPEGLASGYGLRENRSSDTAEEAISAVCRAWEDGVNVGFFDELERLCREALVTDSPAARKEVEA